MQQKLHFQNLKKSTYKVFAYIIMVFQALPGLQDSRIKKRIITSKKV